MIWAQNPPLDTSFIRSQLSQGETWWWWWGGAVIGQQGHVSRKEESSKEHEVGEKRLHSGISEQEVQRAASQESGRERI